MDYNKIPSDIISVIEENRNKEYQYFIDESISLSEQKMLPETKAILFNIFRDYLATEEQKQKIEKQIYDIFCKFAQHDYFLAKSIYDNFVDRGLIEDDDQFQKEWFDYIFNGEEIKHEPQEFKDILGKVVKL